METQGNEQANWFTVFRTNQDDGCWLYTEMKEGRLRQGWGVSGLALTQFDGGRVDKAQWEAAHREVPDWGDPSPKRFAILTRMLQLGPGDVVVVPKMPQPDQFTIARVRGRYLFEMPRDRDDYGHIIPVDPDSIRTFDYRADDEAFLISGLFARANHWAAVSFCTATEHLRAVLRLLKRESSLTAKSLSELSQAAVDRAFKAAATSLQDQIATWNGPRFEDAVRQAFHEQHYEVKDHLHYDGRGGDVDILVSPPARHGLFQPEEIAVQVKWKQGVDSHDADAVEQIIKWAESQESNAVKYVISSASSFTENTQRLAAENGVVLIGGRQTMCFLLGVPERYRADWELEA